MESFLVDVHDFNPMHLKYIDLQPDQSEIIGLLDDVYYQELLTHGEAKTAIVDGEVICCAGIYPMTDWIGRAWAIVSVDAGKNMIPLTRRIKNFIDSSKYDRVETPVRRSYLNGHRWCGLLAFVNETEEIGMRHYGIDGDTYDMYAYFPKG